MAEITRTVSQQDLTRLKEAREAADARYNAALTEVDAAVLRTPALPHPPPGPDEQQVTPLNERWPLLEVRPSGRGLRGRVAAIIWRVLEPALARQERFNAALVEHVNRNVPVQRAIPPAINATIALVRQQAEAVQHFQSALVIYLQTLTAYVDTKDYEFAGLARRITEDVQAEAGRLDEVTRGFAAGLSGLSDEILKRYESLTVRDQRYDLRMAELQTSLTTLQQSVLALRRAVERGDVGAADRSAGTRQIASTAPATLAATVPSALPVIGSAQQMLASDRLHSHQYAGFEDLYRGPEIEIRARLADYVPIFAGASDVLDIGCGRGEMLELLQEAGVTARGLDLNHEMVERCRARGFFVEEGDALAYLRTLPPGRLGGLIATQVIEHLQPDYLLQLLAAATDALRPGAPIVLETINPACWGAFFDSYIRDLTHVRPVHPDTLKYLVAAAGFVEPRIEWRAPYPPEHRLTRLDLPADASPAVQALAGALNPTIDRLNALLFGYRDYAVVARRP